MNLQHPFQDHAMPMMAFIVVCGLIGLSAGLSLPQRETAVSCLQPRLDGHILHCEETARQSYGASDPYLGTSHWLLGQKMEINRAQFRDLVQLPRIGRSMAKRIVKERQRSGPFCNLDDLLRVKGIGPRTVQKLRPYASASCAS